RGPVCLLKFSKTRILPMVFLLFLMLVACCSLLTDGTSIVDTASTIVFAAKTRLVAAKRLVSAPKVNAVCGGQIGEGDGDGSLRHGGNSQFDDWIGERREVKADRPELNSLH